MATADAAEGTAEIKRKLKGTEILKGDIGEIEAARTETTKGAEDVATTTPIRQVPEAGPALTGKTVQDRKAVLVRLPIDLVRETVITTHPALGAAPEQIGRTRPVHVAGPDHLLIAAGEIGTTTRPAHAAAPVQIGRIRPDRAAALELRQVGTVMTAEDTIAGVVEIIEIATGATIAVTGTAGATTAITTTAGVMHPGIPDGAITTITTVATGIRTGTTMAGMTAGAGT